MKNKKVLIYYLLEFLLTICIFIILLLFVLKLTILNKNYFIKQLNKTNYYHELYTEIDNDFENYLRPSGFDISIKDNLLTEEELKLVINKNVDNFYKGKKINVDTTKIKERLEGNIDNYLNKINIKISDEGSLNKFKDEFIKIYSNRVIINDELIKQSNTFSKLNNLVNIFFYILIIIFIILFLITKVVFKKITLFIPTITSIILYIISYIFIVSKINIKNIKFWNTSVSNIIKNIFYDNINYIKYIIVIGLILELIRMIIYTIRKKRI